VRASLSINPGSAEFHFGALVWTMNRADMEIGAPLSICTSILAFRPLFEMHNNLSDIIAHAQARKARKPLRHGLQSRRSGTHPMRSPFRRAVDTSGLIC
jgi:hypothetical protein